MSNKNRIGKNRNDIFNPEYRQKKSFFRKSNIYRLLTIISVITIFIWGSRDFIYGYVTGLEIRDRYHNVIYRPYMNINNDTGYFVINKASYNIKLIISCDVNNFRTSYNDTVLIPNQIIYINLYGDVKQDTEIIIKGVKV